MAAKDIDSDLTDVELAKKELEEASEAVGEAGDALSEVTSDAPNMQQAIEEAQKDTAEAEQSANKMQEQFNAIVNGVVDTVKKIAEGVSSLYAGKQVESDTTESKQTEVKNSEEVMAEAKEPLQQAHENFQEQREKMKQAKEAFKARDAVAAIDNNAKISVEQYIQLVDSADESFDKEKKGILAAFSNKIGEMWEGFKANVKPYVYNAIVEKSYYDISDYEIGSAEARGELLAYKERFGANILDDYESLDFVPSKYIKGSEDYQKSLYALSYDDIRNAAQKAQQVYEALRDTDIRNISLDYDNLSLQINNLEEVDNAYKECQNLSPEEQLSKINNALEKLQGNNHFLEKLDEDNRLMAEAFEVYDKDLWYEAIKDTEAYKKLAPLINTDNKQVIFDLTSNLDFLTQIYSDSGVEGLYKVFTDYKVNEYKNSGLSEADIRKMTVKNIDAIYNYASDRNIAQLLSKPVRETQSNLILNEDSRSQAELLLASQIDTSSLTDEKYREAEGKISKYWDSRDGDRNFKDYFNGKYEEYVRAYAMLLEDNPDYASKLFNNSEGADRGILDEKIMEGLSFDIAKTRVGEMTGTTIRQSDDPDLWNYIKANLFTIAYGYGYGFTNFTGNIANAIPGVADGKLDRRQMEQMYIHSILQGDYTLESKLYNKDENTVNMVSDTGKGLKKYQEEYLSGKIDYQTYLSYARLDALSEDDLKYYADLQDSSTFKTFNSKSKENTENLFNFAVTAGSSTIPVGLMVASVLAAPAAPGLGTALYASSIGATSLAATGSTVENLKMNGETDNRLIWTNAILHGIAEGSLQLVFNELVKLHPTFSGHASSSAVNGSNLPSLVGNNASSVANSLENYFVSNGMSARLAQDLGLVAASVVKGNLSDDLDIAINVGTYTAFKGEEEGKKQELSLGERIERAFNTTKNSINSSLIYIGARNLINYFNNNFHGFNLKKDSNYVQLKPDEYTVSDVYEELPAGHEGLSVINGNGPIVPKGSTGLSLNTQGGVDSSSVNMGVVFPTVVGKTMPTSTPKFPDGTIEKNQETGLRTVDELLDEMRTRGIVDSKPINTNQVVNTKGSSSKTQTSTSEQGKVQVDTKTRSKAPDFVKVEPTEIITKDAAKTGVNTTTPEDITSKILVEAKNVFKKVNMDKMPIETKVKFEQFQSLIGTNIKEASNYLEENPELKQVVGVKEWQQDYLENERKKALAKVEPAIIVVDGDDTDDLKEKANDVLTKDVGSRITSGQVTSNVQSKVAQQPIRVNNYRVDLKEQAEQILTGDKSGKETSTQLQPVISVQTKEARQPIEISDFIVKPSVDEMENEKAPEITQKVISRVNDAINRVHPKPAASVGRNNPKSLHTVSTSTYRSTGESQIQDIIHTGYIRPKAGKVAGGHRGEVFWSLGGEDLFYIPQTASSILEVSSDKVKDGQVGALGIDDLQAIWTFDEKQQKYVDRLDDVKRQYEDYTLKSQEGASDLDEQNDKRNEHIRDKAESFIPDVENEQNVPIVEQKQVDATNKDNNGSTTNAKKNGLALKTSNPFTSFSWGTKINNFVSQITGSLQGKKNSNSESSLSSNVKNDEVVERNLNGIKTSYSYDEIMSFKNGEHFDTDGFFEYLIQNGRLSADIDPAAFWAAVAAHGIDGITLNTGAVVDVNDIKDKQQAAKEFAEGSPELEKLLLDCWLKDLSTRACCAGHDGEYDYPYISFNIRNEGDLQLYSKLEEALEMKYSISHFPDNQTLNIGPAIVFYDIRRTNQMFEEINRILNSLSVKDDINGLQPATEEDLRVKSQTQSVSETIDDIVRLMINNGYDDVIERLQSYVGTGEDTLFTRKNGVRETLATLSLEDIKAYLNEYRSFISIADNLHTFTDSLINIVQTKQATYTKEYYDRLMNALSNIQKKINALNSSQDIGLSSKSDNIQILTEEYYKLQEDIESYNNRYRPYNFIDAIMDVVRVAREKNPIKWHSMLKKYVNENDESILSNIGDKADTLRNLPKDALRAYLFHSSSSIDLTNASDVSDFYKYADKSQYHNKKMFILDNIVITTSFAEVEQYVKDKNWYGLLAYVYENGVVENADIGRPLNIDGLKGYISPKKIVELYNSGFSFDKVSWTKYIFGENKWYDKKDKDNKTKYDINGVTIECTPMELMDNYDFGEMNFSKFVIEALKNKQVVDLSTIVNFDVGAFNLKISLEEIAKCIDNGVFDMNKLIYNLEQQWSSTYDLDQQINIDIHGIIVSASLYEILSACKIYSYDEFGFNTISFLNELYGLYERGRISEEEANKKGKFRLLGADSEFSIKEVQQFYKYNALGRKVFNYQDFMYYLYNNGRIKEKYYIDFIRYDDKSRLDSIVMAKKDSYDWFMEHGSVIQSGISDASSSEKSYLMNFIETKYGLSERDALIVLNSVNLVGACSYADMCNMLYELYGFDEEKFEKDFGYPLLLSNGKVNGNQLLLDLFVHTNIESEDGLLVRDSTGKVAINKKYINEQGSQFDYDEQDNNQNYMSRFYRYYAGYLRSFLKSNGSSVNISDYATDDYGLYLSTDLKHVLSDALQKNKPIHMGLRAGATLYGIDGGEIQTLDGGHAVTPVAMTKDGVIVRSWGKRYYVPFNSMDGKASIAGNIDVLTDLSKEPSVVNKDIWEKYQTVTDKEVQKIVEKKQKSFQFKFGKPKLPLSNLEKENNNREGINNNPSNKKAHNGQYNDEYTSESIRLTSENAVSGITRIENYGNGKYFVTTDFGDTLLINSSLYNSNELANIVSQMNSLHSLINEDVESISYENGYFTIRTCFGREYQYYGLSQEVIDDIVAKNDDVINAKNLIINNNKKTYFDSDRRKHVLVGSPFYDSDDDTYYFNGMHSLESLKEGALDGTIIFSNKFTHSDGVIDVYNMVVFDDSGQPYNIIRKKTFFPETWSDDMIISNVLKVGDSEAIGVGYDTVDISKYYTFHYGIIDGVPIGVIKNPNGSVRTAYPMYTWPNNFLDIRYISRPRNGGESII